jgi:hypothetical protein
MYDTSGAILGDGIADRTLLKLSESIAVTEKAIVKNCTIIIHTFE